MPGSVLGALQALSELYIYPHDCNSLHFESVVVPPARANSLQLPGWEHGLPRLECFLSLGSTSSARMGGNPGIPALAQTTENL